MFFQSSFSKFTTCGTSPDMVKYVMRFQEHTVYHPERLQPPRARDGIRGTTQYRRRLRYTQVYFIVNGLYLQVQNVYADASAPFDI